MSTVNNANAYTAFGCAPRTGDGGDDSDGDGDGDAPWAPALGAGTGSPWPGARRGGLSET